MNEVSHQLILETALAAPAFEELLDTAIEVCLRSRDDFEGHYARLTEEYRKAKIDNVLRKIGPWGLREAIEYSTGDFKYINFMKEADRSDTLSAEPNPFIQHKIEAFGLALLDDAFITLGTDAPAMIEKYHAAKTREDKLEIYGWLNERVTRITRGEEAANQEHEDQEEPATAEEAGNEEPEVFIPDNTIADENFYHPARLSPKLIGIYPEISLEPTCLGVSMLTAAFYEKLGVRHLNAGIARTAIMEARTVEAAVINQLGDFAKAHGVRVPDWIALKLDKIRRIHRDALRRDNGFHAAELSELDEERWVQTDPNFRSNVIQTEYTSELIRNAYEILDQFRYSAKGLEFFQINRHAMGMYSFWDYSRYLTDNPKSLEEVDSFLKNLPEDTAMSVIISEIFDEFTNPKRPEVQHMHEQLDVLYTDVYGVEFGEAMQIAIQGVLTDYVFPDAVNGDISGSIARCKTDTAYRQRRVEDMCLAPFYCLLRLINWMQAATLENHLHQAHSNYELGLPAYRIGAAVLSDFASYTGDDLPPSFWLTYWPSHISFAEHAKNGITSDAQTKLLKRTAQYINNLDWTYQNVYDIVDTILEQEEGGEEPG